MITLQLKDIMTSKVVTVSPDTPIEQVAQLMQKHNIGVVPVVDDSGVKGVITEDRKSVV